MHGDTWCAAMLGALALATAACGGDAAADAAGAGAGDGAGGGKPRTTLALPQLVRGTAYVDATAFPKIPLVVAFAGDAPDSVDVVAAGVTTAAVREGDRFVATLDVASIVAPQLPVEVRATVAGVEIAPVMATLTVARGSVQYTDFDAVGPAYASHLAYDAAADAILLSWVSAAGGAHGLWMNELDGAFARLLPDDIPLGDPADEPLDGHTAIGADAIGVVYRTTKPGDGHWLVKLRVVDRSGAAVSPTIDLTEGQAAFTPTQAGVDPGGFSGAWLHISPSSGPGDPPPVEVRFSRWDTKKGALVGPITIDQDQPAPLGSAQGTQQIEPLTELGVACNDDVCVVTYSRDVYIPLVDLNVPKLFVAVVDLAKGELRGAPTPVEASDWDTQLFGHQIVALGDGGFEPIYTANDTAAALDPKSPCDETLERDLLFTAHLDAAGAMTSEPAPLFDFEGTRQYPRLAPHPAGFALLWEDQRSECSDGGHIRMAASVASGDASGLVDPYLELPDSVGLPPEDPTLTVTSTNFAVGWSDDRHGGGLTDPRPEIFLDTYWRR